MQIVRFCIFLMHSTHPLPKSNRRLVAGTRKICYAKDGKIKAAPKTRQQKGWTT